MRKRMNKKQNEKQGTKDINECTDDEPKLISNRRKIENKNRDKEIFFFKFS